jgi:F-type H+-transporting ATPase subunit c
MKLSTRLALVAFALVSSPALAQDASGATSAQAMKYLAAGLAIGLAVIGGTAGQGKAAAAAYEGIGRNPQAADKLFTPLLLGLALIEFQTIMAFIISILMVL